MYYDKCGNKLHDKEDIIKLCHRISTMLKQEANANHANHKNRNISRSRSNKANSNDARESKDAAPCRQHDGAHQWKDCPDNWQSKNRNNDRQKVQHILPAPPLKVPTQTEKLEEKSKAWRVNPPMDSQWSASTSTMKPTIQKFNFKFFDGIFLGHQDFSNSIT
jgi:hypothetical protein